MVIILLSAELVRNLISLPALEDERQWASVGGVSVEHCTHLPVVTNTGDPPLIYSGLELNGFLKIFIIGTETGIK